MRQVLAVVSIILALPAGAQTLTGGDWRVTTLAGGALPVGVAPVLTFGPQGRVAGQSGCNRFVASYAQDGLTLTFGALAGTKMACDADRMTVEQRMFAALAEVRTWALTPGGALELMGDAGLLVRAERP